MDGLTALDNLSGPNPGTTLDTIFSFPIRREEILNALDPFFFLLPMANHVCE